MHHLLVKRFVIVSTIVMIAIIVGFAFFVSR
jgi:hypothetical protein